MVTHLIVGTKQVRTQSHAIVLPWLHFINTSLNGRLLWVCSQSSAGGSALIRGMECMVHITK
jgi:hypothetical protein